MSNKESNTQVKPFFARFLQEQQPANNSQAPADDIVTLKYPSDEED